MASAEDKARPKDDLLGEEEEPAGRRRNIIQLVAACVVAIAVFAAALTSILGGEGGVSEPTSSLGAVPVPAQSSDDLDAAAKTADCELRSFANEGQQHVPLTTRLKFQTNPPTSGNHFEVWAKDGLYAPGSSPQPGNWVHSLEHGRVIFQYREGTPQRRVGQLETLFNEPISGAAGYHTLVLENNTQMPFAVAGVAWRRYIACKTFTDRTFDALRAFRADAVDKAPEQVP